jgi:hypothetical protein
MRISEIPRVLVADELSLGHGLKLFSETMGKQRKDAAIIA